jgi:hypothetical protein
LQTLCSPRCARDTFPSPTGAGHATVQGQAGGRTTAAARAECVEASSFPQRPERLHDVARAQFRGHAEDRGDLLEQSMAAALARIEAPVRELQAS